MIILRKLTSEELNKLSDLDKEKLRALLFFIGGALNHEIENDQPLAEAIVNRIREVIQ